MRPISRLLHVLVSQLSFFTVIPVPYRYADIRLALRYVDLTPLTVSTVLLLVVFPLEYLLKLVHVSYILGRVLLYATALLLTGFIHLDGFTDVVDALFAPAERRFEVLKDPRVGACGAAALTLLLLMGALSLTCCNVNPGFALYLSDLASRATCSISARLGEPLHRGLGSLLVEELRSSRLLYRLGFLVPVVVTLSVTSILGTALVVAVAVSLVLSVLAVLYVVRVLGGISGDVLGFSIELSRHLTLIVLSCVSPRLILPRA